MSTGFAMRRRRLRGCGVLALLLGFGGFGTGDAQMKRGDAARRQEEDASKGLLAVHAQPGPREPLGSPVSMDPVPEGTILVSAHTAGWITPCGCAGSQAGGVARRAGYGRLLKKTFPGLPVFYMDLGGFALIGDPVKEATTVAVLDSMNKIGYEATNAAWGDFGGTLEESDFLKRHIAAPRLSANVVFQDTGELVFPPYRILKVQRAGSADAGKKPITVGIIGVQDEMRHLFAFGPGGRSLVTKPMSEGLARFMPELRKKADLVVLLAETGADSLYYALQGVEGVDFIVAGTGSLFITEPEKVHEVPVIALGNQGKYLAELRVYRESGKPAIKPFVHWLDERFPEDRELARFTEESLDRINEMSRKETVADAASPLEIAPYVGADKCASCHEKAWEVWKASGHARAYETLRKLKRDFTASCVICHVTGLGSEQGGGFANPHATPQLLNVQCEQCHGPAQKHLADPSVPYGETAETLCLGCHSRATDPHFERETRWKVIAH